MAIPAGVPEQPYVVPDVDVRALGQQQLHQLDVFVLRGPDHRRPATIILGRDSKGDTQHRHSLAPTHPCPPPGSLLIPQLLQKPVWLGAAHT